MQVNIEDDCNSQQFAGTAYDVRLRQRDARNILLLRVRAAA